MSIRRTAVAEHAPGQAAALPSAARSGAGSPTGSSTAVSGGLTRRGLGVATVGGIALLAGCADPASLADPSPASTAAGTTPSASPRTRTDEEIAANALAAERLMAEELTTVAGPAGLTATAAAARVVHEAHAELLDEVASGVAPTTSPPTTSPTTTSSTTPGPTTPSPTTPSPTDAPAADPATTAAALARRERRLVDHHAAAAVEASSGTFARLLAGLAAAAAQQAVILERLTRQLSATRDATP